MDIAHISINNNSNESIMKVMIYYSVSSTSVNDTYNNNEHFKSIWWHITYFYINILFYINGQLDIQISVDIYVETV